MALGSRPRAFGRSIDRAFHTVGITAISAALLTDLAFQAEPGGSDLWPATLALVAMLVLLVVHSRIGGPLLAVVYLAGGGVGTFAYLVVFATRLPAVVSSDVFPFALPGIALVMVAGPGHRLLAKIAWAIAGLAVAQTASLLALAASGPQPTLDATTLLVAAVAIAILAIGYVGAEPARRAQPMIARAAKAEQVAAFRRRVEVAAAAAMHDTVLSDLAAIADSTSPTLSPALRRQVGKDLLSLEGEEWLRGIDPAIEHGRRQLWEQTALYSVVDDTRSLGLSIEATGDFAALERLERGAAASLAQAVKQCLMNVLNHAGTTDAEVAVFGSDSDVSVMVIDSGRGFSVTAPDGDRLGLRQSVRHRIESIGGSVQIWSTPGRGTSIMIRVPVVSSTADLA